MMKDNWSWVAPEVFVEEAGDGAIMLRNRLPLETYPANLAHWLHRNARRFPDKPFLKQRGEGGSWKTKTYGQTAAAVNQLSNGLLALALDASAPIAILSENSTNMALIQLAAMQIGQPVVPISYAYSVRSKTGSHIKHILDVTQAPLLLMSDANVHMPKLRQWQLPGVQLYAFSAADDFPTVTPFSELYAASGQLSIEGEARYRSVNHETLAKIQFTSGSTDLPKGVEVTHGMMTSNQVGIAQTWPFMSEDERVVDWLPWNHTFGGNFVFNMLLMHGGTFYIDDGNPTPAGFDKTVRNIIDVSPTVYFGVPRSYTALYNQMQHDGALREAFFRDLKFIFTAAAALDQNTYEGMKAMSRDVRGAPVPFLSAWGCTETAPDATHVYWEINDARVIGLPIPGTTIKLAPDVTGKMELRVKGPNVTTGYYRDEMATELAFDRHGFYRTGDAGSWLDPEEPTAGLIFDGRIGEDFKLSSGVWVHNANLRSSINRLGQPYLLEIVVAAPNKEFLSALLFPNVPALRARFPDLSASLPEDGGFLRSESVVNLFRDVFRHHNREQTGSSKRFVRFALLNEQPSIDVNETTDKGYVNQSAVLANHAALVSQLYAQHPEPHVIVV
jgi:feruloyl-CoA synthase